jgi:hypothetical protein
MERSISNSLRTIFLVHMVISLILGAALWLIPGRTLELLGWVPKMVELPELGVSIPGTTFVDNVLTRLLGAALLAMAFSSFRGWRAERWEQVAIVVQMEFILCLTGVVGCLAGFYLMEERVVPLIGWVIAALLAVFTLLWGWALRR